MTETRAFVAGAWSISSPEQLLATECCNTQLKAATRNCLCHAIDPLAHALPRRSLCNFISAVALAHEIAFPKSHRLAYLGRTLGNLGHDRMRLRG